jgi:hypothetical protein
MTTEPQPSRFVDRLAELHARRAGTVARWSEASKAGLNQNPDDPEWVRIVDEMVAARYAPDLFLRLKAEAILALVKAAEDVNRTRIADSSRLSPEPEDLHWKPAFSELDAALEALNG